MQKNKEYLSYEKLMTWEKAVDFAVEGYDCRRDY